jgi:hypothetical protein
MAHNVLRLGEGCLTIFLIFARISWQLLPNRCYVLQEYKQWLIDKRLVKEVQ